MTTDLDGLFRLTSGAVVSTASPRLIGRRRAGPGHGASSAAPWGTGCPPALAGTLLRAQYLRGRSPPRMAPGMVVAEGSGGARARGVALDVVRTTARGRRALAMRTAVAMRPSSPYWQPLVMTLSTKLIP